MPISRYRKTRIIRNADSRYTEIFKKRDIRYADQYSFEKFKSLKLKDVPNLQIETHVWSSSDRFYKLAGQYYGDSVYWWVIALFNNTPLETDVKIGQKLFIPIPLEAIISVWEI